MAAQREVHFVDRHRNSLIDRVTGVDSLLDSLHDQVLNEEQYQHVRAGNTNPEKMRRLFSFSPSWDQDCRDQLHRALRKTHPHLVKELESLKNTSERETPVRGLRKAVWIPQDLSSRWNLPLLSCVLALPLPFLLLPRLQLLSRGSDAFPQRLSPRLAVPPMILSLLGMLLAKGIYFMWEQHLAKESLALQLHEEKDGLQRELEELQGEIGRLQRDIGTSPLCPSARMEVEETTAASAELRGDTRDGGRTKRDLARRLSAGELDAEPRQQVPGESREATSLQAPQPLGWDSTLSTEGDLTAFLEDVKSWVVTNPEKQLKKLVDFMQKLNERRNDDNAWSRICLSDRAVQDFLVSIATVCKDLPPQEARLTRSHLRLLLNPHVRSVLNFPQAPWLLQWVCSPEEMQRPRTDSSEFADFIRILKEIQNGVLRVDPDSASPAPTEEAQRRATAAVGSALSSLLQTLRATDQSDTELLLLSIAAAAGYVAESRTFGGLLGREEINFLLQEMSKAHETHLALRRQCGPKAQAFLLLTGLTVTSGPTALTLQQKEKRLTVMREHLGKSLSMEVAAVLSRAGADWESLEADLKSLIMGDSETTVRSLPNDLERKERESVSQDKKQMNGPTPRPRDEQRGSVRERAGRDKQDFLSLIRRLGLDRYYPRKMGRADFHQIYKASVHDSQPRTDQELPFYFLQKLLMLDYRLRYLVRKDDGKTRLTVTESLSPAGNGRNSSDLLKDFFNIPETQLAPPGITQTHIHPMDVQMAIFHCADDFTRQYISTKLSICQLALPFVVPNPCTSQIEFPLWSLRQVKKSWRQVKKFEGEKKMKSYDYQLISQVATHIVSFLRVGNSFSSSKSQILNSLLTKQKHDIFFHRHCRGSSKDVLLMGGVVEVCWYCPGGKDDDNFDNCIAFANLHGDAVEHKAQLRFLQEISSVTVVLLSASEPRERNRQVVRELLQSPKPFICLFDDREKIVGGNCGLQVRIGIKNRNEAELMEELRATITHLLEVQGTALSAVGCAKIARRHGFLIDEDRKECKEAETLARALVSLLRKHKLSAIKEKFLPLQGELWHRWCKKDRELSHLRGKGNQSIEQHRSEIEAQKQEIRIAQWQKAFPLNAPMRSMVDVLQSRSEASAKLYFLQWLSVFLDNMTAGQLEVLQQKYDILCSHVLTLKVKMKNDTEKHTQTVLEAVSKEISDSTIGIDHLLREVGQIYEGLDGGSPQKNAMLLSLPQMAADLMVAGYPMELVDGDASYVPLKWVGAVLDRLTEILGDQRLFVLSVLGLQSSGKSTLLNAMFGLQFSVSAGRCSRGAYMYLLKVEEKVREDLGFDFVLVVDNQGLQAPELANTSLNRDNELATFVIGLANLTVINIFGESPSEMQDILQIAVQAFLRMKKVRLSPSCLFVHQNMGEITAKEQNKEGRRRLQRRLDEMVAAAAEQEQISDITRFSDVIRFDVNTHVHYFAHQWEGNPPMAPPNPSYSHNVQDLKSRILTVAKEESQGSILRVSELKVRIQDLWRAVINETFGFSFRNTREIVAMNKLETVYSGWTWQLRSHALGLQNQLNNQIQNGDLQDIPGGHFEAPVLEKYTTLQQELERHFSTSQDGEILIRWKAGFEDKLKALKETLVSEIRRQMKDLTDLKKRQHLLNQKKSGYENKLLVESRELALSLRGKKFSEKELREKFNQLWSKWVVRVSSVLQPTNEPNIPVDLERILLAHFPQEPNSTNRIRDHSRRKMSIDYSKHIQKKIGLVSTLEESDKMNIEQATRHIMGLVKRTIDTQERQREGYNSNYFHEILRVIDTETESAANGARYAFTNQYKLDLALCLFQEASERFQDMHAAFKRANDPVTYLESKREELFISFKIACQGAAASTTEFVDFLWDKVSSALLTAVWDKTAIDLASDMKANFPAFQGNRSDLERHILISLAEEENFENYWQYIDSPREFFRSYVEKQIEAYCSTQNWEKLNSALLLNIEIFKELVLAAIRNSTDAAQTKNGSVSLWLDEFCKHLGNRLPLPRGELKIVEHQEALDVELVRGAMSEALAAAGQRLVQTCSQLAPGKVGPKIQAMLSAQFCGCWEQCPFCKAVCTNTLPDHDGDHSVLFHRPEAMSAYKWDKTENFSVDFCTSLVASDCTIVLSSGKRIPWKLYRQAGGEHATWSITPDASARPYWKWFLCRFRAQLEETCRKKFKGRGQIPDAWTAITKEAVLADLKKT
ncbi:interferon-induced very large GTPase 1-like [Tachyglossus aculeatus]|uniref:interferon-induced very large GTPase 1-like n=1 Tax=Tachyglossus aculeatus TaxID=9261 RepID=UPI0018F6F461|nr:interferon-induced very large GTPase 1-like [Tachyglossus aculeatus]